MVRSSKERFATPPKPNVQGGGGRKSRRVPPHSVLRCCCETRKSCQPPQLFLISLTHSAIPAFLGKLRESLERAKNWLVCWLVSCNVP